MKRLFLLAVLTLISTAAHAQQTIFVPVCSGTNDTARFTTAIARIGSNQGTIRLPYKNGTRCAVNTLTIPANITLDNADGTGIKINNGQTLTTGPVVNPPGKQLFYNVGTGLGTVLMTNAKQDVVDVSWFGPANAADSTNAITAALNIAAAVGGPSATLYFPAGRWVIGSPVLKNLNTLQSQLIIKGSGSNSQLVLGVTSSQSALTIQNGHKVVVRDLVLVGNGAVVDGNAAQWTVWRGVAFSGTLQAVVENVDCYGIQSDVVADGGVIHANNTHLTIRDMGVRSCGGGSGVENGMITVNNWNELTVENIHPLDFGSLNGVFYTSPSVSAGWFRLGNVPAPTINSYSGGYAYFKNIISDEGTNMVLRALTSDGSTIQSIVIDGWRANISLQSEFYFTNVKRVGISNTKVAYSAGGSSENAHPAVYAENVDVLDIENSDFLGRINSISVGPNVGYVRLEDTTYQRATNPNCSLIHEIQKGEQMPLTPCNTATKRATAGAVKEYFNQDEGRKLVSFDGHEPFALHGGKTPSPLYDFFTETALDTAKWDSTTSTNITPTQVNNRLQFTVANGAGPDAAPGTYISDGTYDMSANGVVSVFLPTLPVTASTGTFKQTLTVTAADGTTPIYSMWIDSANNGQIIMSDDAGLGSNPLGYGPYWRIRYVPGSPNNSINFEISANNSVWSVIRTATTTAAVTSVKFRLEAWSINTPATVLVHPTFDDFRFSQSYLSKIFDDGVTLALTTPNIGVATGTSLALTDGPQLVEGRLASVPLVDMNTGTAGTLYTCPTGKTCVVTKVIVRNASTSLTTASYSFGWNDPAFDNVIANATHTELTGLTLYTILPTTIGATRGEATEVFKVLMNTLQGAAATTTIDVFGYTF